MGFVANFICFPTVQIFDNRLRFDEVTESLQVGTFFWDTVYIVRCTDPQGESIPHTEGRRAALFILFYWFTVDLFRWKILLPNCTCKPSFNWRDSV